MVTGPVSSMQFYRIFLCFNFFFAILNYVLYAGNNQLLHMRCYQSLIILNILEQRLCTMQWAPGHCYRTGGVKVWSRRLSTTLL